MWMKLKKIARVCLKWGIFFFLFVVALVIASNVWVVQSTKARVYKVSDSLPVNKVALVLGTSKYSRSGRTNLFFKYRMEAAASLFRTNKIRHFIASGDNSYTYYNEPQDMKNALMAQGIPSERITLDYAGFRTFDSVVRSRKIFRQDTLTIISQEFHCYRALFISDYYGINAIAFAAKGVPTDNAFATIAREYLARFKAVVDLYILQKQPKFLGEEINIQVLE